METNKILNAEAKYLDKIWQIQNSNEFLEKLSEIEAVLKNNFDYIYENFDDKNIIKVAIERLIRFFGYRDLKATNIYPSPLSSDMAIETEDAILCIDAKTINMITNAGDDKSIHFGRNQINFNNIPKYEEEIGSHKFKGVSFRPHLKSIHKNKPVLTFFSTINYEDDHENSDSFKLTNQSLVSVPNFYISRELFNDDLILNYKTYSYVKKELAERYGSQYMPKSEKDSSWKEFKLHKSKAYLDLSNFHPEDPSQYCVWKKIDKKYSVLRLDAGGARISKSFLEDNNRCLKSSI